MRRVGLVGCGKTKRPGRWPARDLYRGTLVRYGLAYVERDCAEVFILSALHGLVPGGQEIESYEKRMPAGRRERGEWGAGVVAQAKARWSGLEVEFVMLAGRPYLEALLGVADEPGWRFRCPLEGMGIGARLGWLRQQLAGAVPGKGA